ncbi:hypothetical protein L211DRAFT_849860 [Terfezia boudieri ATCC MYA-4762]|uniref:C2H2-type domain-containing protein n=1 Tax=Terfezia boudieri ATCC MYA-4762 TaxID=1051890 RepID=A0A3N4LKD7_9PEZI|nr:hypothetical protein L211DRAFT_849860 [Terfezia boudieri ATCC MYA-4762]
MATSPGPTRVIDTCDDPPGSGDTFYRELPPPHSPVALGNYHWDEDFWGLFSQSWMDYAYAERKSRFQWDWFRIDGMEKGLPEEEDKVYDQEKGRQHSLKDHTTARPIYSRSTVMDRFRQSVSSLAAGFLGRAPQNTQDWPLASHHSSTRDYDCNSVNYSLEGNREIDEKDGTNMSEILLAPLEDSSEMGSVLELTNQRYAEVIVSPSRWPAFARNMLSEVLSNDTSDGFPSSASIALLLEKAILNWNAAPRYVGLYPHSADPPIQITEIVAEYPPSTKHNSKSRALSFALPHSRSYHHHRHHHRGFRGAHTTPKPAESLLTSVLKAIKALGPIILTAILRVPLIGRIYKKVASPRNLNKDLKKHLKKKDLRAPAVKIMESKQPPAVECNAHTFDAIFRDWLNEEIIDHSSYNFDEGISSSTASTTSAEEPQPVPSFLSDSMSSSFEFANTTDLTPYYPDLMDDIDPADITDFSNSEPHFNQYPAAVGNHHSQFETPFTSAEDFSYIPLPHTPFAAYDTTLERHLLSPAYGTALEGNWQTYFTPSSSIYTDFDNMETSYPNTNPGLSSPTSQNVTPQTEGLETPTFTPSCSRASSVTSPPQQSPPTRRYACKQESCGHKEFDRPCDLNKHLKTHNKHLECDFETNGGCQMRFSTEKDRKRHRETVHEKKRPFICHLCVKEGAVGKEGRFSRKDNLRIHRKKVHGVD